jgi:hypothetical protein
MRTCPWCGYPYRSTDERGPQVDGDGDLPDPTPARNDEGSFYCPRCEETVTPGGV